MVSMVKILRTFTRTLIEMFKIIGACLILIKNHLKVILLRSFGLIFLIKILYAEEIDELNKDRHNSEENLISIFNANNLWRNEGGFFKMEILYKLRYGGAGIKKLN